MGVEPSSGSRQASVIVAERDDEPAKPAPEKPVGRGSSAPTKAPPPAIPNPNAQAQQAAPQIPKLPLNADGTIKGGNEALVTALLAKNPGIFFGDWHGTTGVVDTFSSLLPTLKGSGVRILFVEMVPSSVPILEKFQKDGDTKALKERLDKLGWGKDGGGKWLDRLVNMLAEARRIGIKLIGIDESYSYEKEPVVEQSNPHWATVIRATLAKGPKNEKYVIFGGLGHSANYAENKGVNALLGIPSITPYTADDLAYDQAVRKGSPSLPMTMAPGTVAPNPKSNESDFIWKVR